MKLNFAPFYQELIDTLGAYNLAMNTMYVDEYTIAPKKGAARTNEAFAVLSRKAFEIENDPETIARIEEYYSTLEDGTLEKKEVGMRLDALNDTRAIPADLYQEWRRTISESETAWHDAKDNADYEAFKPHLKKVVAKMLEVSSYSPRFDAEHPYNFLLDQFEKGIDEAQYDEFFAAVVEDLAPVIKKIAKAEPIEDSLLSTIIPVEEQAPFNDYVLDLLKADHDRLYLSTTEHPFTDFLSHDDVRITTHYYPDQFLSAVLSTVHEYGHGLYHLQTDGDFDKTLLVDGVGCAAHESQSRLLENHIGRSKAFWTVLLPELKKRYPAFENVTIDELHAMINVSKPSLIRTEADELTYPFHILIRYEIEKKMADGTLDYDTLPQLWGDLYEKYLGVRPANDKKGLLQDMHWSAANIGYFPSYAMGSAYAAQIYEAMCKDIDPEALLLENRFDVIAKWLEDHVHHYGASKTMREIVEEVSGKPFDPHIYTNYLKDKYTRLYNLDAIED